jgi:ribosomal-protein-alanine N-acetyltransferase
LQNATVRRIGEYGVRLCGREDLTGVIAVNWASLPEHYSDFFFDELLREAPEAFLVADWNARIVGYIMCRIEYGFSTLRRFGLARKGHIVSVAVLEPHRRKGVGRILVEEALQAMRRRGCTEAYLEVRVSNAGATALYDRLGFQQSARLENYYRDGEAAYQMSYPLT